MEKGLLQIVEKCENDKELLKEGFELVRDKKVKDNKLSLRITENEKDIFSELGSLAYFNPTENEVVIHIDEIKKIENEIIRIYSQLKMGQDIELGKRLSILQYLLHELEHAYQNQIAKNKFDNSDYAKLSRLCFEQNNANYLFNYGFAPSERLAEINSTKTLSNMLKESNYRNLYYYYTVQKMLRELNGYKVSKAPLMDFLYNINKVETIYDLEIFSGKKKLTLEDKLHYGLVLEKYEEKEQKRKIEKMLRKIK